MIELKRQEAIGLIKYNYLLTLSIEEKGNIIYSDNCKVYDDESENWNINEIMKYKNNKYILAQYNFSDLVTNIYIEKIFHSFYNMHITIIDKPNDFGEYCFCCNYRVYQTKELYSICPICMWEETNVNEDEYSSPNHSNLKEYRANFLKIKESNIDDIKYLKYEMKK